MSTKPQWQQAAPSFHLNIKQDEDVPEQFSVKNEQSYGKNSNILSLFEEISWREKKSQHVVKAVKL